MALPAADSRPGSNGNSVMQRPASRGASGSTFLDSAKPGSRAKFEKLEAVYDFPDATKVREALQAKVLRGSPGNTKRHTGHEKPQAELVSDWLSVERQRADEEAEQRWKAKFKDWHNRMIAKEEGIDYVAGPNMRHSLSDSDGPLSPQSESGSWPGLDPNDPDGLALLHQTERYIQETEKLVPKQEELEREIVRFAEELQVEQQRHAKVENFLHVATDDRDAWSASAARHDLMRKRCVQEQKETHGQVVDLHGQLRSIDGNLTVGAAP